MRAGEQAPSLQSNKICATGISDNIGTWEFLCRDEVYVQQISVSVRIRLDGYTSLVLILSYPLKRA